MKVTINKMKMSGINTMWIGIGIAVSGGKKEKRETKKGKEKCPLGKWLEKKKEKCWEKKRCEKEGEGCSAEEKKETWGWLTSHEVFTPTR